MEAYILKILVRSCPSIFRATVWATWSSSRTYFSHARTDSELRLIANSHCVVL